jgi:hypothetical protein
MFLTLSFIFLLILIFLGFNLPLASFISGSLSMGLLSLLGLTQGDWLEEALSGDWVEGFVMPNKFGLSRGIEPCSPVAFGELRENKLTS